MTDLLQITSKRTGTTVRVIAAGEIDLATVSMLRRYTGFYLADHAEIVVLDLSAVSFIDSSGLHALLQAAEHHGDRLRIIPSRACLRLLDIAGLRDLLPLIDGDRQCPRAATRPSDNERPQSPPRRRPAGTRA
jgi:anti-sigma B factor antagonist